jgi:hypothetical protein
MVIPILMIIVSVWLGLQYKEMFQLPSRSINDNRRMAEYRNDFGMGE